jgi:hypothetical protein
MVFDQRDDIADAAQDLFRSVPAGDADVVIPDTVAIGERLGRPQSGAPGGRHLAVLLPEEVVDAGLASLARIERVEALVDLSTQGAQFFDVGEQRPPDLFLILGRQALHFGNGLLKRFDHASTISGHRTQDSTPMKHIGFLSFGHWTPSPQSQTRSAADEPHGADGAYVRVHHFARQLASPFPLLAAIGARTSRIEIGTAVIDMRYENPLYMVEDAGAADLISVGRLQLGISRGSPEQVIDGFRYFGYAPPEGTTRRRHGAAAHRGVPRGAEGRGLRQAEPAADVSEPDRPVAPSDATAE